ncbi:hypothetical protein [Haladaptatus sp. NG-SE-30]
MLDAVDAPFRRYWARIVALSFAFIFLNATLPVVMGDDSLPRAPTEFLETLRTANGGHRGEFSVLLAVTLLFVVSVDHAIRRLFA